MRRLQFGLLSASAVLVLSTLLLVGCGGRTEDEDEDDRPKKRQQTGFQGATLKPVKGKGEGVIVGRIKWVGDRPPINSLTEGLKKTISETSDHRYCLEGKKPDDPADFKSLIHPYEIDQQEYRIGENGNLGNVIVWIEPEADHYFEIPPKQIESIDKEVTITQPHCAFLPHVVVLFPSYYKDGKQVPTGQKFLVENDSRVNHNAKIQGGRSGSTNVTLPSRGKPLEFPCKPEKEPITIACDIHKWMKSYARPFDHPYAVVSSVGANPKSKKWEDLGAKEFGTFEIRGVPVGAKVKIHAWHESAKGGDLGPKGSKTIELKDRNEIEFKAAEK